MALKSFLMNEIYDLRQQLAQIPSKEKQKKYLSNNKICIKELKTKLQLFQKEKKTLRDENINKQSKIETVFNQNNELLNLSQLSTNNRKISTKGRLSHESPQKYVSQKSRKNTSNNSFGNNFIYLFHLTVLEAYLMKR